MAVTMPASFFNKDGGRDFTNYVYELKLKSTQLDLQGPFVESFIEIGKVVSAF